MDLSNGPRRRAEQFLARAGEFRLGALLTESPHPHTITFSQVARTSAAAGLGLLAAVDADVVATYARWACADQPARLAAAVLEALRRGNRVFFTGCGATGRLSVQLDAAWRAFWQARRARGAIVPSPNQWENRTGSVVAGGDYALVKAVEGFEDFPALGRRQMADQGLRAGDVVFAITEGGETPFVIGTAWAGLAAGARVFFVYNNPDAILRESVTRSREILDEPRIEKVNLTTGAMAISGSTRMQATSIQLVVMLTVLEMALRDLLAAEGALAPSVGRPEEAPEAISRALAALHATLSAETVREALGRIIECDDRIYRTGGRTAYLAGSLAVDVLTDTAERSPTFCLPSFRKWDDREAADSWAFLFTPRATTAEAWTSLLGRMPRLIEWTPADLGALLDHDDAARQASVIAEIGRSELLRYRIGLDGLPDRPFRRGDGAAAVVGPSDFPLVDGPRAVFGRVLTNARRAGATTALIGVGPDTHLDRFGEAAARVGADLFVRFPLPVGPFLLHPQLRIGVKMLLNAVSTCTMARLGRVVGNRMVWVVPSNLKLIDRAARYIRDLAGVSYETACFALFEVLDYVEPRRRLGREYPPPVAMATMRLRYGLALPDAEARFTRALLDESANGAL